MTEIKELEKKIYDTISRIEMTMSDFNLNNENFNPANNTKKEKINNLEKENSLLKEKLLNLKKEHQKDLDNFNNIIEELKSILGEENVWGWNFYRW